MGSRSKSSGTGDGDTPGGLDDATIAAIDRSVGIRVRERRSSLGISQQKTAALLGLSFQQLQKYERGINRISASRLYQVALILGVPVSYFFDEVPLVSGSDPAGADPLAAIMLNKTTEELISAFQALGSETERRAFTRLVMQMKRSRS